jgi:hypothetical protein
MGLLKSGISGLVCSTLDRSSDANWVLLTATNTLYLISEGWLVISTWI